MKKLYSGIIILLIPICLSGQSISTELVSLGNFVRRMYEAAPFEGVKVVEDYSNSYLISVIMLEKAKYTSDIIINKVANAKARSNVSKFLNGTDISSDFIIKTEERRSDSVRTEIITYDIIKERSAGMVDAMQTLTSFDTEDGKHYVYVMFKDYKIFREILTDNQ